MPSSYKLWEPNQLGELSLCWLWRFSFFLSRSWINSRRLICMKASEAVHVLCSHWLLLKCPMTKSSWYPGFLGLCCFCVMFWVQKTFMESGRSGDARCFLRLCLQPLKSYHSPWGNENGEKSSFFFFFLPFRVLPIHPLPKSILLHDIKHNLFKCVWTLKKL